MIRVYHKCSGQKHCQRQYISVIVLLQRLLLQSGDQPDLIHLRRFGCLAYSHVSKEERQKLDVKARECIMLGYGVNEKGYRLYDVEKRSFS